MPKPVVILTGFILKTLIWSQSLNDSLTSQIVNKASWERGFAHGSVYKSECIDLSEKIKQGDDSLVFGVKPGDPRILQKLDDDGLPFIGAQLQYGDPYYSYVNLNTGESFVMYYK